MAQGTKLEIVSPERLVVSETVTSVTVPGTEGYFTVLGDHAPLMTTLKRGFVTVVGADGGRQSFYVQGGFADVSPEGLTILAEEARSATDFDRAAVERALAEAQAQLSAAQTPEERSFAQEMVSGWMNLILEAGQLDQAHIH